MLKLPTIETMCCSPRAGEPEPVGGNEGDSGDAATLIEASRGFHALADPTRLAILRQLRERGEVCACDFVACCDVAQPTVSHHLKVLRETGLVFADKRGIWMYYRLNQNALDQLRGFIP